MQNVSSVILTHEAEGSVGARTSIQYGSIKIARLTSQKDHYHAEAMGTGVKEKTKNAFEIIICVFIGGKTCYRGSGCFGEAKEAFHIQLIMRTWPRVRSREKSRQSPECQEWRKRYEGMSSGDINW